MSRTTARKPAIRTLRQLHEAILNLVDDRYGSVDVSVRRFVVDGLRGGHESRSTFFCGDLDWRLPEPQGGLLHCEATGDTLSDVLDRIRVSLRRQIEERARQRQLDQRTQGALTGATAAPREPLRLEYRP